MEPVQAQSMHITDSKPLCSSPPNAENGVEEISKQMENELLYGGMDDGDALSDDALSEDSYRLRVSDDENLEEKIVDTSKIVENHENNLVNKNELKESTSEVLTTNGDTLQLDKINGSSTFCEREKNAEQNFNEDYALKQDNCCQDKITLDSDSCAQLKPAEVESSSSETGKIILVNSHKPLSDIDSDSNEYHDCDLPEERNEDVEKIENNDSPKVLPTSRGDSSIEEQEHNYENSSKIDTSPSNVIDDEHNNQVEKQVDNCKDISTPNDKTEDIVLGNGIEDNENEKGINEPGNHVSNVEQNDEMDDCQIVNSADNEPLTEEPSNSGDIDEHSKEESIKNDDISPVDDKSSEIVNFPSILESSEMISDIESDRIEEQKDSPSVKTSDEVLDSGKRRFSSSENNTSPKKLLCVETSPQKTNKAGSTDDAIEILDETDETLQKPTPTNNILKTLLADTTKSKVNDEIIDVDDDNTIDSMSSGISLSANDILINSDSTNDKTKQDSEIKETPGEQVNLDNSRTRRTRHVRGEQLVPGRDVVTRTKREAAQKAGETVRKNIVTLNNDSDSESSDSNMVPYTPKPRAPSPASLKRNHTDDNDERVDPSTAKKLKTEIANENAQTEPEPLKTESKKTFESVRKFFLRDSKDKLKKLTQEELEELFIQKIVETITMREEIGKLREKAKISERNQEATRLKCQQLSKQINDFDMVLNRFSADRRNNPNGNANPIKINRSVGLQVNFLTDHGVQNLRQLQSAGKSIQQKILAKSPINGSTPPHNDDVNARRGGIKVRSPRRTDGPVTPVSATSQNSFQAQPLISTMTPSSIALSKSVNTHTTASTGQTIHHVVVNGITNSITRTTTKVLSPNNKSNTKLIDLTEEEEKKNSVPPPLTAIITTSANSTNVPKVQTRYQRVVPATNSVSIPQSAIRVVQPAGQPTPTALVNNMNNMSNIGGPQRFVVMQPARQLVIAPNGNQIRATTGNNRGLSNIAYTSVPTMPNGTVRVVPTSGTTVQLYKVTHPAPLPDVATYPVSPTMKLPPPAPSLKISKVAHGIVLSWNMAISDKYADIASYQLYAYQEISGMAPTSSNWKKVGDVRALPLPMACTLTQFSEGNNYYFAVRAVDTHSRYGQYSQPGNISL